MLDSPSADVYLPQGALTIVAYITNKGGSATRITADLTVLPPPPAPQTPECALLNTTVGLLNEVNALPSLSAALSLVKFLGDDLKALALLPASTSCEIGSVTLTRDQVLEQLEQLRLDITLEIATTTQLSSGTSDQIADLLDDLINANGGGDDETFDLTTGIIKSILESIDPDAPFIDVNGDLQNDVTEAISLSIPHLLSGLLSAGNCSRVLPVLDLLNQFYDTLLKQKVAGQQGVGSTGNNSTIDSTGSKSVHLSCQPFAHLFLPICRYLAGLGATVVIGGTTFHIPPSGVCASCFSHFKTFAHSLVACTMSFQHFLLVALLPMSQ